MVNLNLLETTTNPERFGILKSILDLVPNPIYIKDKYFKYIFCNKAFEDFTGFFNDDIIGKTVFEVKPYDLALLTWTKDEELAEQLITQSYEVESSFNQRAEYKHVIYNKSAIQDSDGNFWGIIGAITDISEQKKFEKSLVESELKYKTLIESSPLAITITNLAGELIYSNSKAAELFHAYAPEDMLGFNVLDSNNVEIPDKNKLINELMGNGKIDNLELVVKRKDGSKFITNNHIAVVYSNDSTPKQVIAFGMDVSERKTIEIQLKKYKKIVEQSPNSIVITDKLGNIEYVNPKFTELTGYTAEEVIGKNPRILKSGMQGKEYYLKLWSTILAGKTWEGEMQNIKKNGEFFWEHATISSLTDKKGEIINFIAIKVDVTDKKKAEEIVKNNERMFRTIIASASDAIILIDGDDKILQWNNAATKIFGYSRSEALNYKLHEMIVPPEYKQKAIHGLHEFHVTGKGSAINKTLNLQGLKKGGQKIDIELSLSAVKLWGRWHAIGIIRDITDRLKIQNDLNRLTDRYKGILGSVPDIIMEVDEQKRYIWSNRAGYDFFGDDVIGKRADEYFVGENNTFNQVEALFTGKTDKVYVESYQRNKEGQVRLLAWWCKVVKDNNENFISILSTARDISEYQNLKKELELSHKMESIGRLAAGIAHEINTPLQYISNSNYFVKYGVDVIGNFINELKNNITNVSTLSPNYISHDEIVRRYEEFKVDDTKRELDKAIERTELGIENVSKLVRAMKNFAHPSGGEKAYSSINDGINDTITISRNEWKYAADIETILDPSLPLVRCCIDELNQVFLNLIINSAHAIEDKYKNQGKGQITIITKILDDNYIEIKFSDDGIGIPDDVIDKIFEPFFTTKDIGKGSGQGLPIVHDIIVNKHKGRIKVNSRVNVGTDLIIILPINNREVKE